ncbi:MAG: alpha/beta fold hydrolase [Alphaproteobacteria bacterium]
MSSATVKLADVDIDLFQQGSGTPLLWLHGAGGFAPNHAFVAPFAQRWRLIVPSHPGFGRSALPDWLDSIDDIAYLYLELLDQLGLSKIELVGTSLGGWMAAEIASKIPERIAKLVLVGPVGVKVGPFDKLDIPDIWALPQDEVNRITFHDPKRMLPDLSKMPDEQVTVMLRNRETTALLTWKPWMHNPKLKHRLHRVKAPTLFVRGASDGLVSAPYMESYARLLPNARIATIAEAGHVPHLEQPEAFAKTVFAFLDG